MPHAFRRNFFVQCTSMSLSSTIHAGIDVYVRYTEQAQCGDFRASAATLQIASMPTCSVYRAKTTLHAMYSDY